MEKMKMHSYSRVDANVSKIEALFPNCVTEVINDEGELEKVIDFDALKEEFSTHAVEGKRERYQFTWPDKNRAKALLNQDVTSTLRPCRAESVDFDNTENLYIEGDNLEVLKLLQETYLGKIKMIYIDPPYNTGHDFVYSDNFTLNSNEFIQISGEYDNLGNRLIENTDSNGRFHTDWLNMIYPRLRLSRDLLSDDGVIFISIDEHELVNLEKIANEIFGESNHVGDVVVKSNPRGSMSTSELASLHEYLVIYSKNRECCSIVGHLLKEEMSSEYKWNDENGDYRLLGLRMRGGFWRRTDRPKLYYPIFVNPHNNDISLEQTPDFSEMVVPVQPSTLEDGTWRWSKEKFLKDKKYLIAKQVKRNDILVWDIFQKDYLNKADEPRRTKAKSIWDEAEINYQNGTVEIKNLFNKSGIFDYSKPVFLIKRIIEMIHFEDNDYVLDFFSGSATTAQAVMECNFEDGIKRNFIMVQIPELLDKRTEAFQVGYKNICDIGMDRVRRAGAKIKGDNPLTASDLDVGFRVLKLDSSNMNDIYYKPSDYSQDMLAQMESNIKSDRTPEDLLFQVMLDLGVELSSKIDSTTIKGKEVFNVAEGWVMACFDEDVSEDVIIEVAKQRPRYFVMRDSSMAHDTVSVNFDEIFNRFSPDTIRKVM